MTGNAADPQRPAVIRLRPGVDWRDVQGDVVALDLRRSRYLATNSVGAVLWGLLSTGATADDLVSALVDRFDVTDDTARADVDAFLRRMAELELVEGPAL